ncbi:hypothetical protein D9M68_440780 [compost metagenome]
MRRFWVTARIRSPIGVLLSRNRSAAKTVNAKTIIHSRFQVIVSPPSSKAPDIHEGLPTSRLVGPKIERTACCRISDMPQVASKVSSGRP